MPVAIVQVMNNTSLRLDYSNTETKHRFSVEPKTVQFENDGLIPASGFYNDRVPADGGLYEIQVSLNNGPYIGITTKNSRFCFSKPVDGEAGERADAGTYGDLDANGQFVLRVDEINDGIHRQPALTFYPYEDQYGGSSVSYILQGTIAQALPIICLAPMAIWL